MQRTGQENGGDDRGENELEEQFQPAADAVGFFLRDFQVIVDETERAEIDHAEESEPDETIIRPRPEDTRR